MLYALRYPFSFVVLVAAFVLGLVVRGLAQQVVSGRRRPAWVRRAGRRRGLMWLKPYVDPFGCVAAALGGIGWGAPVEEVTSLRTRTSGRRVAEYLAGPVVLSGLGIAALVGFREWTHRVIVDNTILNVVVKGDAFVKPGSHFGYTLPLGQVALFLAGVVLLAMGILSLVPLPPLDGGRLLFSLPRRSLGWQKARYRLDEENWGVLVLLIFALPILTRGILLVILLGHAVDPVVRAVV